MLFWDERLADMLKKNNIVLDDGSRYMDDVRLILDSLKEGWRWTEGGLFFSEGWKTEDEQSSESSTQRTGRILKDMMNSVLGFLRLTIEIADDFDDMKLPTLDLKIWIHPTGRIILYEHFEKTMNTNLVLQKASALSENIKVNSLSQEVVRILLNCSEADDDIVRVKHLNQLSTKMKTSGYNTPYIRKVLVNGIKSYENKLLRSKLAKDDKNYSPLHLSKKYNATKRLENKLLSKTEWFKEKAKVSEHDTQTGADNVPSQNDGRNSSVNGTRRKGSRRLVKAEPGGGTEREKRKGTSTVMFVPWTSRGLLAAKLRLQEDRLADLTGFRIRYTEEGGTQLWRFFNTGLAAGLECGRAQCVTCGQDDEVKINCFTRSVVYESVCLICHPDGRKAKNGEEMIQDGNGTYTGETSRSIFERVREHSDNATSLDKDSHMVKHWFLEHPEKEEMPNFKFKIVGKYGDCLTRQIKEAVRISHRPGTLNSKGEFGGGRIPRLVIEKTEYEEKKARMEEIIENNAIEEKWEEFLRNRESMREKKGKRKLLETSILEEEIRSKMRRISLENLHEGRKAVSTARQGQTQWETVLEGWKCGAQLAIQFQNQGMPALEYMPWEGGKEDLSGQGNLQPPHNTNDEDWQHICTKWPSQATDHDKEMRSPLGKTRSIRGGKKGAGKVLMKVMDITDHFKKLAKKENLVSKGSPIMFSPKRKLNLEKSDISSPSKRSKFQDTRHFWKSMQGDNNSNKIVPGFKTTSSLVTELASGSETKSVN